MSARCQCDGEPRSQTVKILLSELVDDPSCSGELNQSESNSFLVRNWMKNHER